MEDTAQRAMSTCGDEAGGTGVGKGWVTFSAAGGSQGHGVEETVARERTRKGLEPRGAMCSASSKGTSPDTPTLYPGCSGWGRGTGVMEGALALASEAWVWALTLAPGCWVNLGKSQTSLWVSATHILMCSNI